MNKATAKNLKNKSQRQKKVRSKIFGTATRPRLSVFRSNKAIFVQLIDDENGKTLASCNVKEIKKSGDKTSVSSAMGKFLAQKALEKNIKAAVFDRGGNKYHGRVKALAEAVREAGLKI